MFLARKRMIIKNKNKNEGKKAGFSGPCAGLCSFSSNMR